MLVFIKKIVSGITFKKILIIFLVGLVSRIVINCSLDVNVFKEYTNAISLVYYAVMASFTVFINNLPSINLSMFKPSIISEAINILLSGSLHGKYMVVNGYFTNNLPEELRNNDINRSKLGLQMREANSSSKQRSYNGVKSKEYKGYSDNKSKPSIYIPGAGAAWYGMNHMSISSPPRNSGINTMGIIGSVYNENKFGLNKKDISSPYNPRGTLLSNRGTNALGHAQINYKPSNREVPGLGVVNSKASIPNSSMGDIPIKLDIALAEGSRRGQNIPMGSDSVPGAPVISRLSTPSTMEPLFPSSRNTRCLGNVYENIPELDSKKTSWKEVSYNELFQIRKEKVLEAINNRETIIGKRNSTENFTFTVDNNSSVELSLNYAQPKEKKCFLDSICVKFYEKGQRTYQWWVWEKRKNNFNNYNEFKSFWDKRATTLISLDKKSKYPIGDIISELVRIRNPFKK